MLGSEEISCYGSIDSKTEGEATFVGGAALNIKLYQKLILDFLQRCVRPWVKISILPRHSRIITVMFAYITFLMGGFFALLLVNISLCGTVMGMYLAIHV